MAGNKIKAQAINLLSGLSHNLFKNYPSVYATDGSDPLWYFTTNCTLTEEDATGGSLTNPPNERVLKAVTTAADGQIRQAFNPSTERLLVASVSVLSGGAWVYVVTSGTLTVSINDSVSGVLDSVTTTTTGSWVYLEVTGVTIGANVAQFVFSHSANAATFYVANPVLNLGPSVIPWSSRGLVYREAGATLVTGSDPGGATAGWTDLDWTSVTSLNTVKIDMTVAYRNTTATGDAILVRRYGSPSSGFPAQMFRNNSTSLYTYGQRPCLVDDYQRMQYYSEADASDSEELYIGLFGYWEWE